MPARTAPWQPSALYAWHSTPARPRRAVSTTACSWVSSYTSSRTAIANVVRVRSDGLKVKSWIYLNDPDRRRYEGFVAQDVAEIYPEAVVENYKGTGYLAVNYALIPHEAAHA